MRAWWNDPKVAAGGSAVVVALVYLALLGHLLVPASLNPLALARMSRLLPAERFWDQAPPLEDGPGYDGQFFYYLARDPLLLGGDLAYLGDDPAYRYQRILLPVLAHALALGTPGLIGWTLIVVNLLGLALGCWYFVRLLDHLGASRWWLVPAALNPGYLLGVALDLSEPLALGLAIAACYAYARQRHLAAALLLTVGVLARETLLLLAAGFALYELLARRAWRSALVYAAPAVAAVGWQLVVLVRVGSLPIENGSSHLGLPYVGLVARLQTVLSLAPTAADSPMDAPYVLAERLAMVLLAAGATLAIAGLGKRTAFGWQLAIQGLFVLMLNERVWGLSLNFARPTMLLYLFYLIATLESRRAARPVAAAPPGPSPRPTPAARLNVGQPGATD